MEQLIFGLRLGLGTRALVHQELAVVVEADQLPHEVVPVDRLDVVPLGRYVVLGGLPEVVLVRQVVEAGEVLDSDGALLHVAVVQEPLGGCVGGQEGTALQLFEVLVHLAGRALGRLGHALDGEVAVVPRSLAGGDHAPGAVKRQRQDLANKLVQVPGSIEALELRMDVVVGAGDRIAGHGVHENKYPFMLPLAHGREGTYWDTRRYSQSLYTFGH